MRIRRVRPDNMDPVMIKYDEDWHKALCVYDNPRALHGLSTTGIPMVVRRALVHSCLIDGTDSRSVITDRGVDVLRLWNNKYGPRSI